MSFILDALKKSETERQRADAPALYETKKAPPRHRVATWLIVLAVLLVINVVVLSVVLLHGTHGTVPTTDGGTPAPPPTPAPAVANTAVASPGPAQSPGAAVPQPPDAAAAGAAGADDTAADTPGNARQTDDDAPAVDPRAAGTANQGGSVRESGTGNGDVPSYEQAATAPGANLPQLKLDLHAYAANPADRFIFLNSVKLMEGQTSPQGVLVESITPDGAILSWQGSRFLLERQ
jgi:general secretion pathway protein B